MSLLMREPLQTEDFKDRPHRTQGQDCGSRPARCDLHRQAARGGADQYYEEGGGGLGQQEDPW